jgi:hypothetical protein
MRRKLVLGVGLAALVGGTALGQFASERGPSAAPTVPGGLTPAAPVAPGGLQPLTPPAPAAAPVAPAGGLYTPLYSAPSAPAAYVPPSDAPRTGLYEAPAPAAPVPSAVPSLSALSAPPVNVEVPTSLPKDHPWLLRPEHGAYFIIVKSYVRPAKGSTAALAEGDRWVGAGELAEALARDIRETHKVQTFLYEYISEERKVEWRNHVLAMEKAKAEYRAQVNAIEQKARLQGFECELPDNKLRMRTLDYQDQVGVLVGGFKSDKEAKNALAALKKWEAPKNTGLLDKAQVFVRPTIDSNRFSTALYVNPFETAFVVPNPSIAHAAQPAAPHGVDPFVVKLNEGRPYSLLKATKGWTLGVKSFTAPVQITNSNETEMTLAHQRVTNNAREVLTASAKQAESLAKTLRELKGPHGEPLNLEAFVLHTRTTSLVTVGQFDAADDPALQATQRLLSNIQASASQTSTGPHGAMPASTMFPIMMPIPIPKQ